MRGRVPIPGLEVVQCKTKNDIEHLRGELEKAAVLVGRHFEISGRRYACGSRNMAVWSSVNMAENDYTRFLSGSDRGLLYER
jgi:hypothetical protein